MLVTVLSLVSLVVSPLVSIALTAYREWRPNLPWVHKADVRHVWLGRVHPALLAELPPWPPEGIDAGAP